MGMLVKGLVAASCLVSSYLLVDRVQDAKGDAVPPVPKPGAEHKWLAEAAGKWKAEGKFLAGPDMWVPMNGVQTNTMQPGGLWQLIEFKQDGGPFVGNGMTGYDPHRKKFVSVWCDNMSSEWSPAEGSLSADGKALTIEFMKTDEKGSKVKVTETVTRKDKDHELLEMFQPGPDGKPMKVLEIAYTRM